MNLALKYRPSSFHDLVGQEVLVRILSNSFSAGKLTTPVLMVGASGVGKTTCARIVSLCLNCESGPTAAPCGVCSSCVSIKKSQSSDVIEMDAASNTGVDDIRVILESSNYLPTHCRFKVYIIDEVHMLSTSAFNALLKTLESPSEHVKFIMATTEARKVPVTVVSRCLRLDLSRLSVEKLFQHLLKIAKAEGMNHDDNSIKLIAKNSSGSVRNALLLLEQAYVYTGNNIVVDEVRELLGCIDENLLASIVCSILNCDVVSAVEKFRSLCSTRTAVLVFEGIQQVAYELCMHSVDRKIPHSLGEEILSLPKSSSTSFLSRLWQLVVHGIGEIKSTENQEQAGEMLIVRLCYLSDMPSPQKMASFILSGGGFSNLDKKPSGFSCVRGGEESFGGNTCVEVDDQSALSSKDQASEILLGVGERKKNDVNVQGKMYNPDEDEIVSDFVKSFKGAVVVGSRCLDIR
ncbi:MAG: DNA polymerase III subunit gamma/tau [Aaplasma endosymbiont of Hyalomma asiaticum]